MFLLLMRRSEISTDDGVRCGVDAQGGAVQVCSTDTTCGVDGGGSVLSGEHVCPVHSSPFHASLSSVGQHCGWWMQMKGGTVVSLQKSVMIDL